jgi:hypothetical protein
MRPADNIEKLLSETHVPGLKDGPHRAALKRKLLARIPTDERPAVENSLQGGKDTSLAKRRGPWRRITRPQWIGAAAAVAGLTAIVLVKQTSEPPVDERPESAHVIAPVSSSTAGNIALEPPDRVHVVATAEGERLAERSLEQRVALAQVIVVATALDSAPAPPQRPGELPEAGIRFRVTRVLKGNLADEVIMTRTPSAAAGFIGKEWVILLSPEYMAGEHQYADCNTIDDEPEVKAILSRDTK